jgi:hypothetical protein
MTGGLFQATAETLLRFDGEDSRLAAFAEFFHHHPQAPVLDFEHWANQRNLLEKESLPAAVERIPVRFSSPPATGSVEQVAGVGVRTHSTAS